MSTKTVAELLVETLAGAGVERIYGVAGDSLNGITDSIGSSALLSTDRWRKPCRQELSMPPTITLEQVTGFSLFMLKAVLSGHGDELIDLARINLLR